MSVIEDVRERTGFLNLRKLYDPREYKAGLADHIRRRMRLEIGESIMQRLSDSRAYVVRIWEGEEKPYPYSDLISPLNDLRSKDTIDTEVPSENAGHPSHYGSLWATALIVLQDYRDAEIGEYVFHTMEREGASTVFTPYKVESLDKDEFDVMRFGIVKFLLPGHETMRVMQREL